MFLYLLLKEGLIPTLEFLWKFFLTWWWVILPFLFWKHFTFMWLWWRIDLWLEKQSAVILEIKLPREILKPIRAMEIVLSAIHDATYQPPDLYEKWIDGQVQLSTALEMVSIEGEPHFFIRTPKQYRDSVEASLYAQYPEIEIREVDDYTKYVPQDLPNKDWDMFGSDYKLAADDWYPIKTYLQFETEHEALEEKRIDPIAGLLEAMAKIKKGEQLWIQFVVEPIGEADELKFWGGKVIQPGSLGVWRKKGEELRDKLARREAPEKQKSILGQAFNILITGKVKEEEKEKEIIPPEMKLTPGEREILGAIEMKMSKPIFSVTARFIYLGRREVWFKPNFRLAFSYFSEYNTTNLNALYPNGKTLTKIKDALIFQFLNLPFIKNRRRYLRCRKLLRNYIGRDSPFFPKPGGTFNLNVEEVASLFHFPSSIVAPTPTVSRIEAKKGGPPPELPVE